MMSVGQVALRVEKFPTLQERMQNIILTSGVSSKRSFARSLGYGLSGCKRASAHNSLIGNMFFGKPVYYYYLCELANKLDKIPLIFWKDGAQLFGLQPDAFRHPIDHDYLQLGYISDVMRAERVGRGMSQSELAERAKLSNGMISNLETYHTTVSTDSIHALCNVFGLEAEWLAEPLAEK